MAGRKRTMPTAFAVIRGSAAPKALANEARISLLRRLDELGGDEKVVVQLLREVTDGETSKDRLKAIELYLSYRIGRPVETVAHVEAGRPEGVSGLTTQQLEDVASSPLPRASESVVRGQAIPSEQTSDVDPEPSSPLE